MRIILYTLAIVATYIYIQTPLPLAPAPPCPTIINVDAAPGVTALDQQTVTRAANFTAQFFHDTYQTDLTQHVTITVVPTTAAYMEVLQQQHGLDDTYALFQATHSAGITVNNHIIINLKQVQTYDDLIFITAHELTHQYQLYTMGASPDRYHWLLEGMADIVAAHIVAANFEQPNNKITEYRKL